MATLTHEEMNDEIYEQTNQSIFDTHSNMKTLRKPPLKQKVSSPKILPSLKENLTARSSLPMSTVPNSTVVLSTND